jgi:hypothetical protein
MRTYSMPYDEIPDDDTVVATLEELAKTGRVTAGKLCDALVASGYPRADSQLAIQRTVERRRMKINNDWTLSASILVAA